MEKTVELPERGKMEYNDIMKRKRNIIAIVFIALILLLVVSSLIVYSYKFGEESNLQNSKTIEEISY